MKTKKEFNRVRTLAIVLSLAIALLSCNKAEKEAVAKREQARKDSIAFIDNFHSYPGPSADFISQVLKKEGVTKTARKAILEKGMRIVYKKDGKTYGGTLLETGFGYYKDGKIYMADGARVIVHPSLLLVAYLLSTDLEGETYDYPTMEKIVEKYPVGIQEAMEGNHGGGVVEGIEDFRNVVNLGPKTTRFSFIPGKGLPHILAWRGEEPYLFNDDNNHWKERSE